MGEQNWLFNHYEMGIMKEGTSLTDEDADFVNNLCNSTCLGCFNLGSYQEFVFSTPNPSGDWHSSSCYCCFWLCKKASLSCHSASSFPGAALVTMSHNVSITTASEHHAIICSAAQSAVTAALAHLPSALVPLVHLPCWHDFGLFVLLPIMEHGGAWSASCQGLWPSPELKMPHCFWV